MTRQRAASWLTCSSPRSWGCRFESGWCCLWQKKTKKQICLYIIFNQTLSGLRASLASSLTKMTKERTFSHKLVTTLSTNKATTYSYLSLLCTKKANLCLFFVFFVLFYHRFYRRNCSHQKDSNSDRENRRWACWPLDHYGRNIQPILKMYFIF